MSKKILAWAVLVVMAAGLIALTIFARAVAFVLIGAMTAIAVGRLVVWALEVIGWL